MVVVYLIAWSIFFLMWGRGYPEVVDTTPEFKAVLSKTLLEDKFLPPKGLEKPPFLLALRQRAIDDPLHYERSFEREYETWLVELSKEELDDLSELCDAERSALAEDNARGQALAAVSGWAQRRIMEMRYSSILTWMNVLVAVFLIWYFGWGPLLRFLDSRAERIKHDLDASQKEREEAQAVFRDIRKKLEDFDTEKSRILSDANETATAESERIAKETAEAKARIDETEKEYADLELLRAKQNFQALVVGRASEEAHGLLEGNVKKKDQEALVEAFIAEFDAFGPHFAALEKEAAS